MQLSPWATEPRGLGNSSISVNSTRMGRIDAYQMLGKLGQSVTPFSSLNALPCRFENVLRHLRTNLTPHLAQLASRSCKKCGLARIYFFFSVRIYISPVASNKTPACPDGSKKNRGSLRLPPFKASNVLPGSGLPNESTKFTW